MGCIPSQTDHQEKLSIKQQSKPLGVAHKELDNTEGKRSGNQSNSFPPNIDPPKSLNNEIQPEASKDQNSEKMDVEMMTAENEQDYPAWEVQPLQLVRDGKIGRGGAGNVIKATDPSTGRLVALKAVPLNMKEEHTVEFLKKLRELYDSRHPNVTAFHGAAYDVKRSEMVIAFEYMDQRSLKDIVLRTPSRQIPEDIMGCCAGQIVAGLHYLHDKRRIIHRDIKPSNILLNSRGQFKLADFGMSKELHTMDAGHTWVGTSSYMSPERVGGETYSFNADLWSLGVLVLESCTGHSPYEGTTQYDILDRIVDGDPPALPPTFSNQAIDFVHLCTKKLPSERPHAGFFLEHPYVKLNANAPTVTWLSTLAPDVLPT